jgi:GTP cyclohydrolase II
VTKVFHGQIPHEVAEISMNTKFGQTQQQIGDAYGDFGHDTCRVRNAVDIPIVGGKTVGTFFSFERLADNREHIAIGLGPWRKLKGMPLVRLHSECMTGDVFASQRCDCGQQLAEAIGRISEEGGFLIYLRQEGRGIGLYNKLESYRLQLDGVDTYAANRALGFEDDLRNYKVAAQMLIALGHDKVRILTNNPSKVEQLRAYGITVAERLGTGVYTNPNNRSYLTTKMVLGAHKIDFEE